MPTVYYWCIVKIFRADLHENLRRKLTQANFNAHQSLFGVSDVAEHTRFGGVSYNKDYSEKSPRFASLTNLDNFSLHSSSSKFDDEQDSYKRSKSLFTVMSIDSLESVDSDECHIVRIFNDTSLTSTEKAMKILNIKDSDIDEARIRLGKSISSGPSKEKKIIADVLSSSEQSRQDAQITSTDNVTTNKETLPVDPPRLGNIKESAENETLAEKSEDDKTTRKVRSHDKTNDQKVIEISSRNPLSGCVCGEAEGGSVRPINPNAGGEREESSDESDDCQGDVEDDSSKDACDMEQSSSESLRTRGEMTKFPTTGHAPLDHDSPPFPINDYLESAPTKHMSQQLPLKSMLFSHSPKEARTMLTEHLEYPDKMQTANYQLFRIDDITVNQDKNGGTPMQEAPNGIGRTREGDAQPSDEDLPSSADVSTSTQTQGSDSWENALKYDKGRPAFLIGQESFRLPIAHFSHWHIPDSLSTKAKKFCRLSKTERKSEKISDREARELEALRAYNKLTLLEDRREMEAKKKKSSLSNWVDMRDLIYATDLSSQPLREFCEFTKSLIDDKKANRARREKTDRVRKSQTRCRPEEKSLKLSTFNMQIDALKASISSGFSNDNKTRFRSHYAKINAHNTAARSNQDARKELSNHSKPLEFQENQQNFYQPATRIEGIIKEEHEIVNIRKDENGIDDIPSAETPHGGLENCFAKSISTSGNEAEIQHYEARNSQRISSIRETVMSIDWDFNGRSSSEINVVPPHENFDWRHENFLWDILDETNTITLLQSAFSSNPENTSRGFYLGPGSTELYYVSNCLDGVVEEIMKTARMRVRHDAPSIQTTSEIDYGSSYLQEFTVTGIETDQDDSDDSLTNSDSGTYETSPDNKWKSFTATDPEMCRNGNSARSLDVESVDKIERKVIDDKDIIERRNSEWEEWTSKKEEKKSITDILGHQELSQLEYWTRELKKLASNNHRSDSFEFTRHMQHLTALPGFCVVQKIMDFFRDFVPVSRSTTRATNFRAGYNDDPSNSSRSNGMVHQWSIPTVIEPPNDSRDVRAVNDDIENYTHFYFGTLNDRVVSANELLPSESNEENHRLKTNADEKLDSLQKIQTKEIPGDIKANLMINQCSDAAKRKNDLFNLFATSAIESPSQLRSDAAALQDADTFQPDPSVDSYDSLYSPAGNSNSSDKTVSIGCHSSMEEFGLAPPNPAESCVGTPTDITQAEIDH